MYLAIRSSFSCSIWNFLDIFFTLTPFHIIVNASVFCDFDFRMMIVNIIKQILSSRFHFFYVKTPWKENVVSSILSFRKKVKSFAREIVGIRHPALQPFTESILWKHLPNQRTLSLQKHVRTFGDIYLLYIFHYFGV